LYRQFYYPNQKLIENEDVIDLTKCHHLGGINNIIPGDKRNSQYCAFFKSGYFSITEGSSKSI
jgi:hypothetical protein